MVKIDNFILHSDFPALSNDGEHNLSVTIPSGWTVSNGHNYINSDYVVGSKDASIRSIMSVDGVSYYVGTSIVWQQSVNYPGFGNDVVALSASVSRINSTTIRLSVVGFTPSGTFTVNGARTITAKISTFRSPYT